MAAISIYVAIIIAIVFRLIIMKGTFVLPTFYKNGNEISFNLGSITTVAVGIIASLLLMQSQPELFSNWYVAGITAYTAPQIVDGVITAGTRFAYNGEEPVNEDEEVNDNEGV